MEINSNPQKIANYSVQFRKNGKFAKMQNATHWSFKLLPRGKKWYLVPIPKTIGRKGRKEAVRAEVIKILAVITSDRRRAKEKKKEREAEKRKGKGLPALEPELKEDSIDPDAYEKKIFPMETGLITSNKYGKIFEFNRLILEYKKAFKITPESLDSFLEFFNKTVLRDILILAARLNLRKPNRFILRVNGSGEYMRFAEDAENRRPDLFGISTNNREYNDEENMLEDIVTRVEDAFTAEKSYLARMMGQALYFNGIQLDVFVSETSIRKG